MGLDMYLIKKTYINPDGKFKIKIRKKGKVYNGIDTNKITTIVEQMMYWRKANAIHKWFVDFVQDGEDDCEEYCVSVEELEELLKICEKVKENNELAEELLPTYGGFFFGSEEYDEYYFQEIDDTIKVLKEILDNPQDGLFYYQSSW